MTDTASTPSNAPGRGLWIGLAVGLPIMVWGAIGAFDAGTRVRPAELTRWVVGAAIVHDLVVLPVTLGVGVVLRRLVPPGAWPPVRWALVTTAVASAVAWPFVRGYGRTPSVPSLLARPYGSGLLGLIATVWILALLWTALRLRRRRDRPPPQASARSSTVPRVPSTRTR